MKRAILVIAILLLNLSFSNAQEKKTNVLKLQPFSFITGSLNLQQEIFSIDKKRSTVILLGVRNVNNNYNNADYNSFTSQSIAHSNQWRGATIGIDRRVYVPAFQSISTDGFDKNKIGLYFSLGAKVEYNQNTFDRDYYTQIQDPIKQGVFIPVLNNYEGRISYLGIMPNINLGLQFTVFQNLYCDINLGGGLKFISKKVQKLEGQGNTSIYYNDNLATNAIEAFVIREGVRPNFGFGLGLEI